VIRGVRYGTQAVDGEGEAEDTKANVQRTSSNVFERFPFHADPGIRSEDFTGLEERMVLFSAYNVQAAHLHYMQPAFDAAACASIRAQRSVAQGSCALASSTKIREVSPNLWRAAHFVELFPDRLTPGRKDLRPAALRCTIADERRRHGT